MTNTPILAIDIDGVLSPLVRTKRDRAALRRLGWQQIEWQRSFVPESERWRPYTDLWLHPMHAKLLCEFSVQYDVELVWASLWGSNSNRVVGHSMGLPRLPFVDFHHHSSGSKVWKWQAVAEFAEGRPLAWLDDGFCQRSRKLSGFDVSRRNQPTLLHEVNPQVGLTRSDLDSVASWLRMVELAW